MVGGRLIRSCLIKRMKLRGLRVAEFFCGSAVTVHGGAVPKIVGRSSGMFHVTEHVPGCVTRAAGILDNPPTTQDADVHTVIRLT